MFGEKNKLGKDLSLTEGNSLHKTTLYFYGGGKALCKCIEKKSGSAETKLVARVTSAEGKRLKHFIQGNERVMEKTETSIGEVSSRCAAKLC